MLLPHVRRTTDHQDRRAKKQPKPGGCSPTPPPAC